MDFLQANPVAVKERRYRFSVVKEFLDINPAALSRDTKGRLCITREPDFLAPKLITNKGETEKEKLDALIEHHGGPEKCRLVYITRHGESTHNLQKGDVEAAIRSHYPKDRDPRLTDQGVQEAIAAGVMIRDSEAGKFGLPGEIHCSSLARTVQTAIYAAGQYVDVSRGEHHRVKVHPTDGLREFMAPGQLHVSDGRGTKTALRKLLRSIPGTNEMIHVLPHDLPEDDDVGFTVGECYVNADIRLGDELHRILTRTDTSGGAIHIVTHNRAIQSILRLLGYAPTSPDYRVFEFENAATVALVVRWEETTLEERKERRRFDEALQALELRQIRREYLDKMNSGFRSINTSRDKTQYACDLERLEQLAEVDGGVQWRVDCLKDALKGTFADVRRYLGETKSASSCSEYSSRSIDS
ncbi:hypothetical protein ACRALDRAFT_1066564 [Sodiomyces alcalophilus JCM 7366]|uniref:uncharacterized protein n=1 Tax=Sodiomyces alcalophilus JCM 7366 TaxID=591952 RepID=UPI0039B41868